MTIQI